MSGEVSSLSSGLSALPGAAPQASAIALYARETAGYAERVAATEARLQEASFKHGGALVQATSLGAEDMVITHLIARLRLPVAIATLDTGALHAETLALLPQIQARYGLDVTVFSPVQDTVINFVRVRGERAMYESLALRKECCALRKLEPLARMLHGHTGWITGLRREQSNNRAEVPFEELDANGRTKINLLADWSWADVWHFIATHEVPFNALHDQFMPSIGCAPCTRAIAVGEDFRAGRWWWENDDAKECGLHKTHSPATAGDSRSEAVGVEVSAQAHFDEGEVKDAQASGRRQDENAKECGLHKAHSNEELKKTGAPA